MAICEVINPLGLRQLIGLTIDGPKFKEDSDLILSQNRSGDDHLTLRAHVMPSGVGEEKRIHDFVRLEWLINEVVFKCKTLVHDDINDCLDLVGVLRRK